MKRGLGSEKDYRLSAKVMPAFSESETASESALVPITNA